MDFRFTPEQQAFREEVLRFARNELDGNVAARDEAGEFPRKAWSKCAEFGIQGLPFAKSLGGSEAGVVTPWMERLFGSRWYRGLVARLMKKMGPGELLRLTLRKRFVDDEVRTAIDDGARQLLIVGAGFDTLGLRVTQDVSDVVVVEVDLVSFVLV